MKRDDAAGLVVQRLGGNRTDLLDRARAEMALAQFEVENGVFLPWFLERDEILTLAVNGVSVALPARFLREFGDDNEGGVFALDPVTGAQTKLSRVGVGKGSTELGQLVVAVDPDFPPGKPEAYALRKDKLDFFPRNDNTERMIRYIYLGMDDEQVTNVENLWLKWAPDVLIAKTCVMLAEHIVSMETNVSAFDRDLQRAMSRLHTNHEARMNEGRYAQLGES